MNYDFRHDQPEIVILIIDLLDFKVFIAITNQYIFNILLYIGGNFNHERQVQ